MRAPLCWGLSPPARQDLLGLGAEVRFEGGAVLLREGDSDPAMVSRLGNARIHD